jgi:hypothetical protein
MGGLGFGLSFFRSFESGRLPEDLPEEKTNTYLLIYRLVTLLI